ncbi:MAG TPA: prepilin-type N-terminal cleavage/methylation domain-containing protein [Verrucomicrobiae bacterium]|jgi:prepilin-type N-terminal cleavage/methylation domain-containing protein|nr:prepilin-type N-terminal cleavage/methylation domain-containing protein [Verrucomicrobiae bacterium]
MNGVRPKRGLGRRRFKGGFTLIEIMIVIAIIAIIMSIGVPSMMRGLERNDLTRAIRDTIEGCKVARDRAILQGKPYEFVIRVEGDKATLDVRALPQEQRAPFAAETVDAHIAASQAIPAGPYSGFPRQLGDDVIVQMIDVNFVTHMEESEARARFFPNGTCDEFTVVYSWHGKQRSVMADVVTGLANEFVKE